jgi:hypothetical protein
MDILHSCQYLEADHGGAEDAEATDAQAERRAGGTQEEDPIKLKASNYVY